MFEPDKYPSLDDYYEEKHRAVLVERGEVIMYLHCRFSYCEYIVSSLEKYIKIVRVIFVGSSSTSVERPQPT